MLNNVHPFTRKDELVLIHYGLKDTDSQSLIVQGPSGSGKTTLLMALYDWLRKARANFVELNATGGALQVQQLIEEVSGKTSAQK